MRTRTLRLGLAAASVLGLMSSAHANPPPPQNQPDCLPNLSGGASPLLTTDPGNNGDGNWGGYTLVGIDDQNGMVKPDNHLRLRTDAVGSTVFASWQSLTATDLKNNIIIDNGGVPTTLWIGLGDNGASTGTLIKVDLSSVKNNINWPAAVGQSASTDLQQFHAVSSETVTPVNESGFKQQTWPGKWVIVETAANQYTFSIQLQLPVAASGANVVVLPNVSQLHGWSQLYTTMPGSTTIGYAWGWTATQWTNAGHQNDTFDGGNAPGLTAWRSAFQALANSPVQECFNATGAVQVDNRFMGVNGTNNPDGYDGTVNLFGGSTVFSSETLQTNPISATVFNTTQTPIPVGGAKATFKVAEWGSQTSGSWIWLTSNGDAYTSSGAKQFAVPNDSNVPANEANAMPATNASQIPSGGFQDLIINWLPSMGYACQFSEVNGTLYSSEFNQAAQCPSVANYSAVVPDAANGTQADALNHHQCIQVHVTPQNGASFNEITVQRNMEFGHASEFQEKAKIDTRGLPHVNNRGHWVYIYVEALNLPERFPDGNAHTYFFPNDVGGDGGGGGTGGGGGIVIESRKRPAFASLFKSADDVGDWRDGFPTYIVHVYHETGRKYKGRMVLEPQTSFGYFIAHEDTAHPAYGFRHILQPLGLAGFTWQVVAPNYYRVFVPNDGSVYVNTTVQSIDNNTCSGAVATCLTDPLEQLENAVSKNCAIEAEIQKLEQATQLQCVDLMNTMNDVLNVSWGKQQGKVYDLVTELKMQSGCGC